VIALPSRACRRLLPVLVDFVDRGEIGAETASAFAHLDRCDRCRDQLETTALAITALRRLGDQLSRADVPDTPPLPPAVPHRRQAPVAAAGALLATAFVALLVFPLAPSRIGVATVTGDAPPPASHRSVDADPRPARVASPSFWEYWTYGLTNDVLWPPSGPNFVPLDPEQARFDLTASGRRPGTWSIDADRHAAGAPGQQNLPSAGHGSADSI
jgi:hypothetical protein